MKQISPYHLGATLFVPATHKNLESIVMRKKFRNLQSLVIDTEDGISSSEISSAIHKISSVLDSDLPSGLLRFIRPQNITILQIFLDIEGIDKIDGFVLPKFDENVDEYLQVMKSNDFYFMPSIEGRALFNAVELEKIRDKLLAFQSKIICVRFGAEDMLKQLTIQRSREVSLYDMLVPSTVIANLLMIFKPYDFEMSAPVYKFYEDEKGFKKELAYELQNGLVSKTIIHPHQIEWLKEVYKVSEKEREKAEKILMTKSVSSFEGEMIEKSTQKKWAEEILLRCKIYRS